MTERNEQLLDSTYYWGYSFDHFCSCINDAFVTVNNTVWAAYVAAAGPQLAPQPMPPVLKYSNGLFQLYLDQSAYTGDPTSSQIALYLNPLLASLLDFSYSYDTYTNSGLPMPIVGSPWSNAPLVRFSSQLGQPQLSLGGSGPDLLDCDGRGAAAARRLLP